MKAAIRTEETVLLEFTKAEAIQLLNIFDKIKSCEVAGLLDDKEEWSEKDYSNADDIGYKVTISLLGVGIRSDKSRRA